MANKRLKDIRRDTKRLVEDATPDAGDDTTYQGIGGRAQVGPLAYDNAIDDVDVGIFNIDDPKTLARLNTFVSAVNGRCVLNPEQVLRRLRDKLSTVGLHFDFRGFPGEVPEESVFPLTQFGGRQGFLDDSGDVTKDDGIQHRTGTPLGLFFEAEVQEDGRYALHAAIMPLDSNTVSMVSESRPPQNPLMEGTESKDPVAHWSGWLKGNTRNLQNDLKKLRDDHISDIDDRLDEVLDVVEDLQEGDLEKNKMLVTVQEAKDHATALKRKAENVLNLAKSMYDEAKDMVDTTNKLFQAIKKS